MRCLFSSDAVQDTRQDAKEKYEAEHMTLVVANQEQEKKLAKYKAQIRELKSKQQQQQQQQQQQPLQEDSNDGLFDVLPQKQHASTPEPIAETDGNLENSMKKVIITDGLFLSWVSSGCSGFFPQGKLAGRVRINIVRN
jgi:hypothetical protein